MKLWRGDAINFGSGGRPPDSIGPKSPFFSPPSVAVAAPRRQSQRPRDPQRCGYGGEHNDPRLGIHIERIAPVTRSRTAGMSACTSPLEREATKPAAPNVL